MQIMLSTLTCTVLTLAMVLPATAASGDVLDGSVKQTGPKGCHAVSATQGERLSNLVVGISRLSQRGDDWSGSLRYRWQAERRGALVRDAQFGQQLELKLGYLRQMNDNLTLGLRLSVTERVGSGIDPFWALGASDRRSERQAELDHAFLHYSAN